MSEPREAQSCILAPEGIYSLRSYKDEAELERLVVQNSTQIFGLKSVYFDIKQKVESKAKVRITDGLLLDLNNADDPKFWIVEIELSKHDLYKDVEPQVRGFLRSLNVEDTLKDIRNVLYEEFRKDRTKMKLVREVTGEEDVHFFIDKLLHRKAGVIVVIDSQTPQLAEIVEELSSANEVHVVEFRTYSRGNRSLHIFTPLAAMREREEAPLGVVRMWSDLVQWTRPETRLLLEQLIKKIETEFQTVKHAPRYRWYYFYSSQEMRPDSKFAVLMLGKKKIYVRICVDPKTFQDPEARAKDYKGWFYKEKANVEKGFEVASVNDIPYALTLVKQSYERTC